jgi:tetratricopeptide (TPR) repeat protein
MPSKVRYGLAIVSGLLIGAVASHTTAAQSLRSRSDSADAHKNATRMQTWFERVRRANLPVRFSGGGSPCDARVGRFCQWNERDDRAPKEPKPIREARDQLLRSLDSAAAHAPTDDWIAGQRIRYLVEAGRDTAAVRVAESCAGTKWWCDALKGLAYHEAGNYATADSAFHEALREMPDAERCRWTDLSFLLDDGQRKRFGKVGCGRNEALAARLWWLADPFLALPGNDRETEHYARHVMSRILDGTRAGYSVMWGDDLRELVVRYGWSRYWSRAPGNSFDPFGGPISGHEATPNYHFFPASSRVDSITDIDESTWDFNDQQSVERYSPRVAADFGDLEAQLALFRRGDSVQVVAAYDLTPDSAFDGGSVHAALVLQRSEHDVPLISEAPAQRGWFSLTMNSTPRLLSLEAWNAEKKHGGRIRRSVWLAPLPVGAVGVSDILLFDAGTSNGGELSSILPFALGSSAVGATKKLGLYWETYGLARPDSALPVSLTLSRVSSGLRKLVESIGLGKRSTPMSIAWRETPALGGIATRSVVLDLSLIPRGRYRLKLELTPKNGPPVTSTRIIDIT